MLSVLVNIKNSVFFIYEIFPPLCSFIYTRINHRAHQNEIT
jgi:hypothetical protein